MARLAEQTPYYRQSDIYRRQGVELSPSTLERWSDAVSDLLRQYVLLPRKVHNDDIPEPVQEAWQR